MSGPIVRSYGVPNWDEIFGKNAAEAKSEKKKAPAKKAVAKASAAPGKGTKKKAAKSK